MDATHPFLSFPYPTPSLTLQPTTTPPRISLVPLFRKILPYCRAAIEDLTNEELATSIEAKAAAEDPQASNWATE